MQSPSHLNAVPPSERNFSIDVMRGIAVLGILLMNVGDFGTNMFYIFWSDTFAGHTTVDGFIFNTIMLLFDGRMRGLFTLLFGAGIMLFIQNKKTQSIQVADAYFRRMTWLLIFGMIDSYLLLWTGDVLFEYALCGIFIFVFRNARVRYMLLTALLSLGIFTIIEGQRYYKFRAYSEEYKKTEMMLKQGKTLNEEQQAHHDEFKKILNMHYPFSKEGIQEHAKDITQSITVHRSNYFQILENHTAETFEYHSQVFFSIFGESFGTILIGMALFKMGFFHGRLKKKTYLLIAFIGIVIGLALTYVNIAVQAKTQAELWDTYRWRNFSLAYFQESGRVISTIGYAALIYLLSQIQASKKFFTLFANVGRMALTNYIMQTIMASLFFFGFGFGQFGNYGALGLLIFCVSVWIIQIAYSNIYMRHFQMGPLEWLWKRLTYGKPEEEKEAIRNN